MAAVQDHQAKASVSAGTGGTRTRWRTAHQGKQHVPRSQLPHRSRQPQEEAAREACAISYGRAGSSIWLCFRGALRGAAECGQSGACGWCARSRRGGGEKGGGGGIHVPHTAKFPLHGGNPSFKQLLCPRRRVVHLGAHVRCDGGAQVQGSCHCTGSPQ